MPIHTTKRVFGRWPVHWRIYCSEALSGSEVSIVRGALENIRQTQRNLDAFQDGLGTPPGLR